MIKIPLLLLIGGTGRKIGKTALASMLIEKFGKTNEIIAVKISNMKPGDEDFHGLHDERFTKDYLIVKEKESGDKDSQRMLGSGAAHSFFIMVQDRFVDEAFETFLKKIDTDAIIVCESNSLRNIVEPGLFIMLTNNSGKPLKAESEKLLAMCDIQLAAHDYDHFAKIIGQLQINKSGWFFQQ
jgi:hypothetical protein